MRKRSTQVSETLDLGPRAYKNVLGKTKVAENPIGPLRALYRRLIALSNNYKKINVAMFCGCAPCIGTKQINRFRLKLFH